MSADYWQSALLGREFGPTKVKATKRFYGATLVMSCARHSVTAADGIDLAALLVESKTDFDIAISATANAKANHKFSF